jgi:hypothetical protein
MDIALSKTYRPAAESSRGELIRLLVASAMFWARLIAFSPEMATIRQKWSAKMQEATK